MANPNPEIYGLPETWQGAKNIIAIAGDSENRTQKPRIANFGGGDGSLSAGNTAGKTVIDESIDHTICPCGQDSAISPFTTIKMFKNHQDASVNINPEQVITSGGVLNWFLYDANGGYIQSWNMNHNNESGGSFRWLPNASLTNNLNGNINPYVYWELKSLLISVEVITIEGYNASGTPRYANPIPLAEWKSNYQSRPVADIRLSFIGVQGDSGDTISYYSSGAQLTNRWGGVAYIGELYDNIEHYAMYSFLENFSFDVFGHLAGNWFASSAMFVLNSADMFDSVVFKSAVNNGDTQSGWCLWYEIPYSEDNYNKVLSIAALFACPFTPTSTRTFNKSFTDPDLYIPIIDDEGIAHGEYTHGADNANNDLYNADSVRDKDYDPSKPYDPNIYDDTTTFNDVSFQQAFTRRYLLSASQVWDLAGELWSANATKDPDETMDNFVLDEYLTNNPVDTIVSLKYFPCTFTDVSPIPVYLGKYETSIIATGLSTSVRMINYDYIHVWEHFGDFRDYEPYTTLAMYIPFCGTVKIPTAEVMGNWVGVKLAIDTATGAATGYVMVSKTNSGGICVATATGTAAIDIPVSGLQSANIQQAVFNAAANWTQTQISNAKVSSGLLTNIGKLTGNETLQTLGRGYGSTINNTIPTTLSGLGTIAMNLDPNKAMLAGKSLDVDTAKSNYELHHIDMPMRLIGSASPVLSTVIELNCRLIIYRPITDESALANYGDTVGFATIKGGTVSQFSGYTEGTIDVSGINATADEKQAIAAAFANGVYL